MTTTRYRHDRPDRSLRQSIHLTTDTKYGNTAATKKRRAEFSSQTTVYEEPNRPRWKTRRSTSAAHPEAAITCRWKNFKGPKTDNKVNRSFQNPGGRSCSALGRAHHDNSKTRSVKVPKSIRVEEQSEDRADARTHSRRRGVDTEGGSRGPTASGGGPSAGGRLRRRTVEHQSSLLMKTERATRPPPTRTTSVGQVGHRRRAMSAASPSFLTYFSQRSPCHVVCLPG